MVDSIRGTTWAVLVAWAVCTAAFAENAGESLVLCDFEGKDSVTVSGGQVSGEQAHSGAASMKWSDQPKNPALAFKGAPVDWSAYDTLSFWLYSAKENGAGMMLIVNSEDKNSDGMDYYSAPLKVDWTGWRFFEFPFSSLGVARKPRGWNGIDGFSITASGWNNEPKADTVLYLDDVRLEKAGMKLRNDSFDEGATKEGMPLRWQAEPAPVAGKTSVGMADDGHTGKGLKIEDKSKENAVGVQQRLAVEPGKKYKVSCWKKGDPIGLYLRWVDSRNQMIEMNSVKMTNSDSSKFEEFSVVAVCPADAPSAIVWVYSFNGSEAVAVVDDVKIEVAE